MSSGEESAQILEKVMEKIEDFYFSDDGDDSSGEALFNAFAAKHEHLFDEMCDPNAE